LRHCNNIKAGVYVATALRPADDQEFVFPQQPEFHWAQFEKNLTSAVVNILLVLVALWLKGLCKVCAAAVVSIINLLS